MGHLIIKKGYTIKVISWENDLDNVQTFSETHTSKERVIAIARLIVDLYGRENGIISNVTEIEEFEPLVEYAKVNMNLITTAVGHDCSKEDLLNTIESEDYETLHEILKEYCFNNLIGSSEFYMTRVCEEVNITYSPENVYNMSVFKYSKQSEWKAIY